MCDYPAAANRTPAMADRSWISHRSVAGTISGGHASANCYNTFTIHTAGPVARTRYFSSRCRGLDSSGATHHPYLIALSCEINAAMTATDAIFRFVAAGHRLRCRHPLTHAVVCARAGTLSIRTRVTVTTQLDDVRANESTSRGPYLNPGTIIRCAFGLPIA